MGRRYSAYCLNVFALVAKYYNQVHGAQVRMRDWNPQTGEGAFVGDFYPPELGAQMAGQLLAEGADIIFPVAGGSVGMGAAQTIKDHGQAYLIGVDFDYATGMPDFADIVLTSVLKRMDVSVFQAAEAVEKRAFSGGTHVGALENGGSGWRRFTSWRPWCRILSSPSWSRSGKTSLPGRSRRSREVEPRRRKT